MMHVRRLRTATALLLAALASAAIQAQSPAVQSGPAQAAPIQADRVTAPVQAALRTAVPGHIPPWAAAAVDRGPIADATPVALTFSLTRSGALQMAFLQLLADQQNPSSPRYHQWLTPQQIGVRFGPTQDDLAALTAWLTGAGLQVGSIEPSGLFVHASGSAAVVAAALGTSLHTYAVRSGALLQAPASEPSVPSALAPLVAYIGGLTQSEYHTDFFKTAPIPISQTNIPPASAAPGFTLSGGGVTYHFMAPADFTTLYDLAPAYADGTNGTGERVAIIGGSRLLASDVTSWESLSGLPSYQPSYIVPAGSQYADPGITANDDEGEGTLDFERVYGTAPSAGVDQVISTNWLNGTVTYDLILYAINTSRIPS